MHQFVPPQPRTIARRIFGRSVALVVTTSQSSLRADGSVR
jgi:hypothetical protein